MRTSRLYCNCAYGDVQTFACCSWSKSVFRLAEIPQLIRNKKIDTINGKPRDYFHDARKRIFHELLDSGAGIRNAMKESRDAAYRRIAAQELRQDFQTAANNNDPALREDAIIRAKELGKQVKAEFAQKTKPSAKAEKADRKAAFDEMVEANPHLLAAIAARHGQVVQSFRL